MYRDPEISGLNKNWGHVSNVLYLKFSVSPDWVAWKPKLFEDQTVIEPFIVILM